MTCVATVWACCPKPLCPRENSPRVEKFGVVPMHPPRRRRQIARAPSLSQRCRTRLDATLLGESRLPLLLILNRLVLGAITLRGLLGLRRRAHPIHCLRLQVPRSVTSRDLARSVWTLWPDR